MSEPTNLRDLSALQCAMTYPRADNLAELAS